MTGTRLMSGSLATSLRKRSIAATPSIIPSSMLTSMTWALLDLLGRDRERGVVVAVLDQVRKRRPGDVGPLTDVDEEAVLGDGERLETGQPHGRRARRHLALRLAVDGLGDRGDAAWCHSSRRRGSPAPRRRTRR